MVTGASSHRPAFHTISFHLHFRVSCASAAAALGRSFWHGWWTEMVGTASLQPHASQFLYQRQNYEEEWPNYHNEWFINSHSRQWLAGITGNAISPFLQWKPFLSVLVHDLHLPSYLHSCWFLQKTFERWILFRQEKGILSKTRYVWFFCLKPVMLLSINLAI